MAKPSTVQKRIDQILDETRQIPKAFGASRWATLALCSLPLVYLVSAVQLAPAQSPPLPVQVIAQAQTPVLPAALAPQVRRALDSPLRRNPTPAVQVIAQAQAPVSPAAPASQLRRALESPYDRWLNQEVHWVISDEERAAFVRLQTDPERQKFIELFWLRRDPTPGTERNEFKEEHYRRIAYANDNFAEAVPGWNTDRGMIYIRFGPPDSIDAHGGVPGSSYPYETWGYRYIEGMGTDVQLEFVDTTLTGRYHLTRDPSEKQTRR